MSPHLLANPDFFWPTTHFYWPTQPLNDQPLISIGEILTSICSPLTLLANPSFVLTRSTLPLANPRAAGFYQQALGQPRPPNLSNFDRGLGRRGPPKTLTLIDGAWPAQSLTAFSQTRPVAPKRGTTMVKRGPLWYGCCVCVMERGERGRRLLPTFWDTPY